MSGLRLIANPRANARPRKETSAFIVNRRFGNCPISALDLLDLRKSEKRLHIGPSV